MVSLSISVHTSIFILLPACASFHVGDQKRDFVEAGSWVSLVDVKSMSQHYQIDLNILALLPGAVLLLHYSVCIVILCCDLFILPVVFQVGKSYKASYDNCTQYTCTESGGQFSLTSTVKVCLPFEESNCVPVSILELEKSVLKWAMSLLWEISSLFWMGHFTFSWPFRVDHPIWRKCAFFNSEWTVPGSLTKVSVSRAHASCEVKH